METQLVRLDEPYNLICNRDGQFAVHIATLIMVEDSPSKEVTAPQIKCFPVVKQEFTPQGEVWGHELNDCIYVSRTDLPVGLEDLRRVMEVCHNKGHLHIEDIPMRLYSTLLFEKMKWKLPKDENGNTIKDFEVNLRFREQDDNITIVYADRRSQFFFSSGWKTTEIITTNDFSQEHCIAFLAELRLQYLFVLQFEGLRSITFKTLDENYQNFVDVLNRTA